MSAHSCGGGGTRGRGGCHLQHLPCRCSSASSSSTTSSVLRLLGMLLAGSSSSAPRSAAPCFASASQHSRVSLAGTLCAPLPLPGRSMVWPPATPLAEPAQVSRAQPAKVPGGRRESKRCCSQGRSHIHLQAAERMKGQVLRPRRARRRATPRLSLLLQGSRNVRRRVVGGAEGSAQEQDKGQRCP